MEWEDRYDQCMRNCLRGIDDLPADILTDDTFIAPAQRKATPMHNIHLTLDDDMQVREVTVDDSPKSTDDFLIDLRDKLLKLSRSVHAHMQDLPGDARNPDWQRMYVFTRQLDGLADTALVFHNSPAPPF